MAVIHTQLELYKDMLAGTSDATQFVIPAVGPFKILAIEGQAAFDMNSAVKVAFGGVVVWFTKGSFLVSRHREFIGDGIKKVELILDATDVSSGSVWLGGFVSIEQVV
jgi:hypothetical protein